VQREVGICRLEIKTFMASVGIKLALADVRHKVGKAVWLKGTRIKHTCVLYWEGRKENMPKSW
jgi:hypothetical protein